MRALYETFLKRVQEEESVKIYGAGKFAKTLCHLFDRNNIKVDAFVVADGKENPSELLNRPVISLDRLTQQDACNIVVGFEKREDMKKAASFLLDMHVRNMIMVSPDIVNDVYCNFIIDQDSKESLCSALAERKNIIAYINDIEGKSIVWYLRENGIRIEAVCTDMENLTLEEDIPVLPYEEISDRHTDTTIVLTMNNVLWQRRYITRLRRSGFENIILIPDKIMREIKGDCRRLMWDKMGAGFHLQETENIERDFFAIQKEQGEKIYRWRIALWDEHPEKLEYIRSGEMLHCYEKQFPDFVYFPYKEVPLHEIEKGDINIEVYMVRSHKDKKAEQIALPDWMIPIQAGKALTDVRIAEVCDDTGDNISLKNEDYSEGTALYWMWKNTSGQDYIGLFHYRRQMALGLDSLKNLAQYDVLLTVPTYASQPAKEFFCEHYILEYDWNILMRCIKEYDEDYFETALKYEKAQCFFPCNIFIMRRKYFDELCKLIFGVLKKVDSHYREIPMVRKDRYLGYLVENLLSIYMMHNAKRLKAAYTDMKFYYPLEEEE